MIGKVYQEVADGVEKLRWYLSLVIERIKMEFAVVKILGKTEKYERDKRDLLVSIGKRVHELSERKRVNVFEDREIKDSLLKLGRLSGEIESLRRKVEEISALEG
ncbi:MAG: hypothetical protein ACWGQW_12025 [bacterium]